MTSKLLFLTLTAILGILHTEASDPKLFIYRNDGGFNAIDLKEDTYINHELSSVDQAMTVSNDQDGESRTVPLAVIDSCAVRTTYIPSLHINLTDYPEASQLWDKELYLDASLDIYGNGYCDDAPELKLAVKGRGNSTWTMPKKPFRLKFPKKTSICGFKKAKSYVLLANFIDHTLSKNALTLWLARRLEMPYANSTVPCDLYLNGHYQGSYLLTEKIGINGGSVDIDEEKGILFELSTEFDEEYRFRSPIYDLPVMVKDPDFTELHEEDPSGMTSEERFALWRDDFIEAERKVASGKGFEAFDINSFVDYFLINNVAANNEIGWPKSVYIYKEAAGADNLYKIGPPWDFDVCYNMLKPDGDSYTQNSPIGELWVNNLFWYLRETHGFREAYAERFKYFEETIYPEMMTFIDQYADLIEPSAKLNGVRWNEEGNIQNWCHYIPSYDNKANVAALKQWLQGRMEFLKSQIEKGKY